MTRDDEIKLKVGSILDEAVGEKKRFRRRLLVWAGSVSAVVLIASIAFALYLNNSPPKPPPDAIQGKITFPTPGSKTDRQFTIEGYTKNIPAERPYIWLTVNVKDLGLCWPKRPWIKANSSFNTSIYEGGRRKEFTVCMYAVGEGYHETFKRWIKDGKFGGIPIIPERYMLDEVTYRLEGM